MVDTLNRLGGARSTYGMKKPVRAATTGDITLNGFQTIDGVVFASTDEANGYSLRCLVKNQSDATENGVYEVSSGDWERTKDFDGNTDFAEGTTVFVSDGTLNSGKIYHVSSADPVSVGTSSISFTQFQISEGAEHGADVASSATVDLDAATGRIVDITGAVTITAITLADGIYRLVRFADALTLTNGASLILPGGQNITTAAGDYALFVGYASSVVRCAFYVRKDGYPLVTQQATIVSAATVDLGSNISQCITVSGAVTITALGSSAPTGSIKLVYFSGAPIITHNGTTLILPGAKNIQATSGDCAIVRHEGSGNWRVLAYQRSDAHPLSVEVATIASAATTELGSDRAQIVTISGVATISSFGSTAPAGVAKFLTFESALTLTYNVVSMKLPTSADLPVFAGDTCIAVHEGSGNWKVHSYQRAAPQRMLYVATTPVSTTGTTVETNLQTYSLAANSLAVNGWGVRLTAWGSAVASTMLKQARLYFDTTVIADTGSIAMSGVNWRLEGTVYRTGSTTQTGHATVLCSSSTILPAICAVASPAAATTGAITLKVTGVGSATTGITASGMTVEFIQPI